MEKDDLYALIMTLRAAGLSKLVTHEMTEFVERFFENTIDNKNKTQKNNQKKNKLKPEQKNECSKDKHEKTIDRNDSSNNSSQRNTTDHQNENVKNILPKLTVKKIVILTGKLGGYSGRKNNELPGYLTFWRGYQEMRIAGNAVKEAIINMRHISHKEKQITKSTDPP